MWRMFSPLLLEGERRLATNRLANIRMKKPPPKIKKRVILVPKEVQKTFSYPTAPNHKNSTIIPLIIPGIMIKNSIISKPTKVEIVLLDMPILLGYIVKLLNSYMVI